METPRDEESRPGADGGAGAASGTDRPGWLEGVEGEGPLDAGRVAAFSDGVFAIAITLLVLTIQMPDVPRHELSDVLTSREYMAEYWAFALSFLIIGAYWVGHHRLTSRMTRVNGRWIWLNLFYLAGVVFVPFPTELISAYGGTPVAAVLYAGTLAYVGFAAAGLVGLAIHDHLLARQPSPAAARAQIVDRLATPTLFALTIPLTPWLANDITWLWLGLIPLNLWTGARARKASQVPPRLAGLRDAVRRPR